MCLLLMQIEGFSFPSDTDLGVRWLSQTVVSFLTLLRSIHCVLAAMSATVPTTNMQGSLAQHLLQDMLASIQ